MSTVWYGIKVRQTVCDVTTVMYLRDARGDDETSTIRASPVV